MFCLLFDVKPNKGHLKHYLNEVNKLNPILETYSGLKWIDRFSLLGDGQALLSLQIWDSEEAILAWREDPHHLLAQEKGKKEHFQDYRITVGLDYSKKIDASTPFLSALWSLLEGKSEVEDAVRKMVESYRS